MWDACDKHIASRIRPWLRDTGGPQEQAEIDANDGVLPAWEGGQVHVGYEHFVGTEARSASR